MSIEKYLSTLTLDQLNYCKQKASELIDKAAQQEKKYVWFYLLWNVQYCLVQRRGL